MVAGDGWVGGAGVAQVSGGGGQGDVGGGEGVRDGVVVPAGGLLGVVAGFAESLAVVGVVAPAGGAGDDVVVVAERGVAVRGAAAAVAQVDEVGQGVAEVAGGGLEGDERAGGGHREEPLEGGARCGRRWWRAAG